LGCQGTNKVYIGIFRFLSSVFIQIIVLAAYLQITGGFACNWPPVACISYLGKPKRFYFDGKILTTFSFKIAEILCQAPGTRLYLAVLTDSPSREITLL